MSDLLGGIGLEILALDTLGRLLLSLALGAAIGLERELSGKPAGLRTNMLICVGAALITEISIYVASTYTAHDLIRSDPARIAAQIVSGVGFLGAGTIIFARGNVVGLTTAATIWVVAAIGIAVGAGAYVPAVGSTVLVVFTLFLVGRFEARVLSTRSETSLRLVFADGDTVPAEVERILEEKGCEGRLLGWERQEGDAGGASFHYAVRGSEESREGLMHALAAREEVRAVSREYPGEA